MSLTDAERTAVLVDGLAWRIAPGDRDDLFAALESIIAARVEAFRAAAVAAINGRYDDATSTEPYEPFPADLMDSERSGWLDGLKSSARIVANLPAPQDAS